MLVPEIALTPQIVGRFVERFGDTVAVLHSRLAPAERYEEWRRLRAGEARVCVGPRSAVFAPIDGPRADRRRRGARRLLQARGRPPLRRPRRRRRARAGARRGAAAGSATPRPESVARACRAAPAATASTVARCRRSRCSTCAGRRTGLHPRHRRGARRGARAAGKAIVLLNRRGWSNFLSCRSCGEVWSCPDCDVALVLHRAERLRGLPPLRAPRARAGALRRLRLDGGGAPRRGHGAPRSTSSARRSTTGASRSSAWTPTSPPAGRRRPSRARRCVLRASRRADRGRADRHADGGQGPRLPATSRSGSCSTPTPRCASPTSAPRSVRSR